MKQFYFVIFLMLPFVFSALALAKNSAVNTEPFVTGFQASDTSENNLILDSKTGTKVVADEVMVGFKKTTPKATIISIVSSINGQVIGSWVEQGIYQVKLNGRVTSSDELATIIATLTAFSEVTFAESNGIDAEISGSVKSDKATTDK